MSANYDPTPIPRIAILQTLREITLTSADLGNLQAGDMEELTLMMRQALNYYLANRLRHLSFLRSISTQHNY